ncbi:hypothetical protein ES703_109475 [subsurface metagenome]
MEKEMKKVRIIALEDLPEVMVEVAKELNPLISKVVTREEQNAASVFFSTLAALTHDIFDYLPPEQQDEILTNCGTWFDIGVLLGKSPQLLLKILDRVNPKIGNAEIPDWLASRLAERKEREDNDE